MATDETFSARMVLRVLLGVLIVAPIVGAIEGYIVASLAFVFMAFQEGESVSLGTELVGILWNSGELSFNDESLLGGTLFLGAMYGMPIGGFAGLFVGALIGWRLRNESLGRVVLFLNGTSLVLASIGLAFLHIAGPLFPIILGLTGCGIGYILLERCRGEANGPAEEGRTWR